MTIALFLVGAAGLWAAVCWVRMQYYGRRRNQTTCQELALIDELQGIRYECSRLFWELGETQW